MRRPWSCALAALDPAEVSRDGVVLEENLSEVTTFSVGHVRVADLVATYYGTQRLTPDHSGAAVYGGSDLVIVRGGFDVLLALDLPMAARRAIGQARAYDTAAWSAFPGMILSRRNYDVAQGLDAQQRQLRSGVLEQSWRMGGASGAEIAALEAFRADPALRAVRASTVEIYGDSDPPPHATVYFRGIDDEVGPMTKYAVVEPYDARVTKPSRSGGRPAHRRHAGHAGRYSTNVKITKKQRRTRLAQNMHERICCQPMTG